MQLDPRPPTWEAERRLVVHYVKVIVPSQSMSTTDLHARPSGSRPTVSATGQAASAESLQHQTPSLENLLARSRVFNERIVESADESPRAEVNVIVEPASVAR